MNCIYLHNYELKCGIQHAFSGINLSCRRSNTESFRPSQLSLPRRRLSKMAASLCAHPKTLPVHEASCYPMVSWNCKSSHRGKIRSCRRQRHSWWNKTECVKRKGEFKWKEKGNQAIIRSFFLKKNLKNRDLIPFPKTMDWQVGCRQVRTLTKIIKKYIPMGIFFHLYILEITRVEKVLSKDVYKWVSIHNHHLPVGQRGQL